MKKYKYAEITKKKKVVAIIEWKDIPETISLTKCRAFRLFLIIQLKVYSSAKWQIKNLLNMNKKQ